MAAAEANNASQIAFENAVKALEAQIANAGVHLTIDSGTRLAYAREVKKMADQLRHDAATGKITWANAARQAHETRNLIMEISRMRSTPIGRSVAQKIKPDGILLNELVALHTRRLHGENAVFSSLSTSQKNRIYSAVVISAGKSNAGVSSAMSRLSYAGRGLLFLSLSVSMYNITTSQDKSTAAVKELTITGAGIGGGIAGGALAGLACGPASPVCVTLGAFVGGAMSAFGMGFIW